MGAAPCVRRGRRSVVGPSALKLFGAPVRSTPRGESPTTGRRPRAGSGALPLVPAVLHRAPARTRSVRTTNDGGDDSTRQPPGARVTTAQVSTTHGPATDLPSPTPQSDVGERRVPSRETRSTEDQDEHEGRDGTARVMTAGLARISVLAPRSMSIVEQLGRSAACQRRRSCDLTVLSSLRSVPDA